jgi:hypothetical protein
MRGEIHRNGLAPGQKLTATFLAESLFPSLREERLRATLQIPPPRAPEPDAGAWLSDYILSLPLASQVALGAAVDMVEFLPALVIGRPLPFSRLREEARDRYVRRLAAISFTPVAFPFLSLRTVLSIWHFDNPERLARLGLDHRCQGVSGRPSPFVVDAPLEIPLGESARVRRAASVAASFDSAPGGASLRMSGAGGDGGGTGTSTSTSTRTSPSEGAAP